MRVLITGGVKSGKSSYALAIASGFARPRRFVATAEAFDDEMRAKILRHQAERGGDFETVEEPLAIDRVLAERTVLDCLTMWVNNMLFRDRAADIDSVADSLVARLPEDIVIVTNEVGLGFIPDSALARRYGEVLGRVNAKVAAACDRVVLMVSGIPVDIKGRA